MVADKGETPFPALCLPFMCSPAFPKTLGASRPLEFSSIADHVFLEGQTDLHPPQVPIVGAALFFPHPEVGLSLLSFPHPFCGLHAVT